MTPPLLVLQNIGVSLGAEAAAFRRRSGGRRGGTRVPGRPQRLRQVDAAADCRGPALPSMPARASRSPTRRSAIFSRNLTWPGSRPSRTMSRPVSVQAMTPTTAARFSPPSVSPGRSIPRVSRAARRGARRSRAPWRRCPTYCCSTSRPITSTCPRSRGLNRNWRDRGRASSPSAMTAAFWRRCRIA